MPAKDPDENTVAIFKIIPIQNPAKTLAAGRPIFDDREICEIRTPGSRDTRVNYATAVSHWVDDPETGEQRALTYAERFKRQYQQFKEHQVQTATGTPLDYAPFLTVSRRAELRALNVYTVEMLAQVDGQPLKNLGLGGRELKNQAQEYIAESLKTAPNLQLQAELEDLRARNALLQEDNERIKAAQDLSEGEFADMSYEQLWDFVSVNGGKAPLGKPNRKALIRMAQQLRQSDNAA